MLGQVGGVGKGLGAVRALVGLGLCVRLGVDLHLRLGEEGQRADLTPVGKRHAHTWEDALPTPAAPPTYLHGRPPSGVGRACGEAWESRPTWEWQGGQAYILGWGSRAVPPMEGKSWDLGKGASLEMPCSHKFSNQQSAGGSHAPDLQLGTRTFWRGSHSLGIWGLVRTSLSRGRNGQTTSARVPGTRTEFARSSAPLEPQPEPQLWVHPSPSSPRDSYLYVLPSLAVSPEARMG